MLDKIVGEPKMIKNYKPREYKNWNLIVFKKGASYLDVFIFLSELYKEPVYAVYPTASFNVYFTNVGGDDLLKISKKHIEVIDRIIIVF